MIDLLEISPLENQFQDLIVYPVLDYIIHMNEICEVDIVDCHNFRQFNTVRHDRRKYSVLVKAVPDLLIAKDFFYNNRETRVFDALRSIASVEVKEPNNNWMLDKVVSTENSGTSEPEYHDKLYLEIIPNLIKNRKLILTNVRRWEIFSVDKVNDKDLVEEMLLYVKELELCGSDSATDYKIDKEKERKEEQPIDKTVRELDEKYLPRIKEFIKKSHEKTWDIIKRPGVLSVNRNIYAEINESDITSVSDINYNLEIWYELFEGLKSFLFD